MIHKTLSIFVLIIAVEFCSLSAAAVPQPVTSPVGVLCLTNGNPVLVNGDLVAEGMTIVSGSEIKTYKSNAAISLGQLGTVQLGLNTTIKLNYGKDQVELNLTSGEASMTTVRGVAGVITGVPDKILHTDPLLETSTVSSSGAEVIGSTAGDSIPDYSYFGLSRMFALTIVAARDVLTILSHPGNGPEISGQIRP